MREMMSAQNKAEIFIAPEDNDAPEFMRKAFLRSVCANDKQALMKMDHHAFSVMLARTAYDLYDEMEARSLEDSIPSFDTTKLTENQKGPMLLIQTMRNLLRGTVPIRKMVLMR